MDRYGKYTSIIITAQDWVCYISDPDDHELIYLSPAGRRILGLTEESEWKGRKCYEVIQHRDAPCPFCTNSKLKPGEKYRWETYNPIAKKYMALVDTLVEVDGKMRRLEMARDISHQKMQIDNLENELSIKDALLNCVKTLVMESDTDTAINILLDNIGNFYNGNRAYIFEYDEKRGLMDNTYEWCAPGVTKEIDTLKGIPIEYLTEWNRKFRETGEFFITSLEGDIPRDSPDYQILERQGIESLIAAPLLKNGQIVGFLGVDDPRTNTSDLSLLRSVTYFIIADLDKRKLLKKMEYLSYLDALTNLQNRNKYISVLKEYNEHPPKSLGILFMDLNGMKQANDTYGHAYGDYLLTRAAAILRKHMGDNSFRIGGDEFVSFRENCKKEEFEKIAEAMRDELAKDKDVKASIGFVWKSGDFSVSDDIIYAEKLMYAEKQEHYENAPGKRNEIQFGALAQLREDIRNAKFHVYLQPVVEFNTGAIVGAEALVRKTGKDGELVSPADFISLYEREGVIWQLDYFVLETVCSVLNRSLKSGSYIKVAVNFSAHTLARPSLLVDVLAICERHGVSPKMIEIEITESISGAERKQIEDTIASVRDAGISVSLDNFGASYSNLTVFGDKVKLDRSLVSKMETDPHDRAIVQNAIQMCKGMKATELMAVGVETERQAQMLSDCQCDYGQGFYFSQPMPIDEFEKLCKSGVCLPHPDVTKGKKKDENKTKEREK